METNETKQPDCDDTKERQWHEAYLKRIAAQFKNELERNPDWKTNLKVAEEAYSHGFWDGGIDEDIERNREEGLL